MKLRGQRRRVVFACALVVTLLLFLYGQGAEFNITATLLLQTSDSQRPKNDFNESNTETVMTWSQHPSVFQQWRDNQPPANQHSVKKDCSVFRGLHVQTLCTWQLTHVKKLCHKRLREGLQQQRGMSKPIRGSSQEASSRSRIQKSDMNGVGVGVVRSANENSSYGRSQKGGVNGVDGVRGVHGDVGGSRRSGRLGENVVDVFSYRHGKTVMMFCSVHKAASTFWIRLFRFLHHDPAPMSRPEALSKYSVHLTPFNQSRPLALAYVTRMLRPGDEEFRFMFTRDPYTRLWSVYIDKFVLPDFFFWSKHTSAIIDERLKKMFPKQKRRYINMCSDISFEEFVQYAVGDPSSPSSHSDDHILPISKTCNPCSFDPNFIGRLENMAEASQAVLERLNLTFLIKQQTFQEHILSQIRTTTEFVYETVIGRGNLRHCVSDEELLQRLLRAFVLSGYLSPEVMWEKRPPLVTRSVTYLVKMMHELFLAQNRTAAQVQKQRTMFFAKAYKALPGTLLLKVQDYYKEDFDSFGYDPEPSELFSDGGDSRVVRAADF